MSGAHAQHYPTKPVRLIVPWSAGSGTDLMSRTLAQKLGEAQFFNALSVHPSVPSEERRTDSSGEFEPFGATNHT